jgi:aminoglycoside phosphotransferase (APT) family kinase protein
MSEPENSPLPAELLQSLLREAGIHGPVESLFLLGVSTCSVWALTAGDRQYVVRLRLDGDPQLARKEIYLSELLRGHGAPAPEVLGVVADEHGVATLSTLLPGIRLDRAMESLPPHELRSAWRSTGEALRLAHEISLPEAGEIVGDQVEPFPGGWGKWVLEDLEKDVLWLREALGEPPVSLPLLRRVISASVHALKDAPARLVHNDAQPQNVLVAPGVDGWRCTGWLDWEFARAADPLWDIGTLDFRPAGLVPAAFYEGYGSQPAEPQASIYDLLMATWRTRVELEYGSYWDWPPQQARIDYLRELPTRIDRLAGLLGVRE